MGRVIPEKFVPYLIKKNTTLLIQLRSIQSRDEQLTLVAGIEWAELDFDGDLYDKGLQLPAADDAEDADGLIDDGSKYSTF